MVVQIRRDRERPHRKRLAVFKMNDISEIYTGWGEYFGCLENFLGGCSHDHLHAGMKIFGEPVVIQVRVRNYYGKQILLRLTKAVHLWKAAYRVFGIKW